MDETRALVAVTDAHTPDDAATAEDTPAVTFPRTLRGYSPAAVDRVLADERSRTVELRRRLARDAEAFAVLERERNRLAAAVDRLTRERDDAREDARHALTAVARDNEQMIDNCRRQGEQTVEQARGEAERIVSEAHGEARRLRDAAHTDAERIMRDASEQSEQASADAERIREEARRRADMMLTAARERVTAAEQRAAAADRMFRMIAERIARLAALLEESLTVPGGEATE